MQFGPVQILVVGFSDVDLAGAVLAELRRLPECGAVRVIDHVFVSKDEEGGLTKIEVADTSTAESDRGAIAGALLGLGTAEQEGISVGATTGIAAAPAPWHSGEMWAVSDAIPPGSLVAVILIEHRWSIPLRDAIAHAGGFALEDTWVHPADLVAAGAAPAVGTTNAHS